MKSQSAYGPKQPNSDWLMVAAAMRIKNAESIDDETRGDLRQRSPAIQNTDKLLFFNRL
jgi:hypothetical protein